MKGGAAGGGYAQVRPDGRDQPPLHRRLPRHHVGAQPAVGDAGQPSPPGQRARHRSAPDHLAAHHRHERPRAPLDRHQPRRHQRRARCGRIASSSCRAARSWRSSPRHRPRGPRGPHQPHHRRPHPRPEAGHRRRAQGRRRHDAAAQGCDPAEPGADPRGRTGAGARRAVRQHRPRLQLDRRHPARPVAGRHRAHRGGLRRRPGRGEVLRHQVPLRRAQARGRRRGRHGPRAQDARRREEGCAGHARRGGAQAGHGQPRGAREERAEVRRAGGRGAQPVHLRHRGGDRRRARRRRKAGAPGPR